jgi:hypothetical protein
MRMDRRLPLLLFACARPSFAALASIGCARANLAALLRGGQQRYGPIHMLAEEEWLTSEAEEQRGGRTAEEERLRAVARAARDGECTSGVEEEHIKAVGGEFADAYGEITPVGFRTLAVRMGLGDSDVFADLGSGLGRCTVQAAAEFGVRRAVGVELAHSRHRLAIRALARETQSVAERVDLVCSDCASDCLWEANQGALGGVTCLYASSLLFSPELMSRLAGHINRAPHLRVVASFKRWGASELSGFREEDPPVRCETSWTASLVVIGGGSAVEPAPGSPLYIYRRTAD